MQPIAKPAVSCLFCGCPLGAPGSLLCKECGTIQRRYADPRLVKVLAAILVPVLLWLVASEWQKRQAQAQARLNLSLEVARNVEGILELAGDFVDAEAALNSSCAAVVAEKGRMAKGSENLCLYEFLSALRSMDQAVTRVSWRADRLPLKRKTRDSVERVKSRYWSAGCGTNSGATSCGFRQDFSRAIWGDRELAGLRWCGSESEYSDESHSKRSCAATRAFLQSRMAELAKERRDVFCLVVQDVNAIRAKSFGALGMKDEAIRVAGAGCAPSTTLKDQ